MALLHDLIDKIQDDDLKTRIKKEADRLFNQKKFGLVFESHLPECTPLFNVPIKVGSLVAINNGKIENVMYVRNIQGDIATCESRATGEISQAMVSELIVVAQFGDPIYPSLQLIDSISTAPDSELWHTLIESDNYHALQLLQYLYAGKIDCIYIDPPYNTGAKDWKYNNDYVDSNDQYRHSKWLSFMERRLNLAKKLLNPKDSVLIVTIDEKEYLHLGCLLEEIFPSSNIQMICDVTNPKGVARKNEFSRVNEFIFFVMNGNCHPIDSTDNMLDDEEPSITASAMGTTWLPLRRSGTNAKRSDRPNLFYPINVNKRGSIIGCGSSLQDSSVHIDQENINKSDYIEVWPIRPNDNTEGRWQLQAMTVMEGVKKGTVKAEYNKNKNKWSIKYLNEGAKKEIESGDIIVKGKDENGVLILERCSSKISSPKTIWNRKSHNATTHGTNLINKILCEKRFDFPKSLYSVKDSLDFFVKDKKDALILDFFAGSGTTLHAVNLLNANDGGNRRCIIVTNNEISAEEAKKFKKQGVRPGDKEWEAHGIARYVTWARTIGSIKGKDINNKPLEGKYLDSEITMADGFKSNVAYYKLGFLDKTAVELGLQFKEVLPIIWMKSGARGKFPVLNELEELPEYLILPDNHMAILIDEFAFHKFNLELKKYNEIDVLFIVTDSEVNFNGMTSLTGIKKAYQLYKDYLDNFRINCEKY